MSCCYNFPLQSYGKYADNITFQTIHRFEFVKVSNTNSLDYSHFHTHTDDLKMTANPTYILMFVLRNAFSLQLEKVDYVDILHMHVSDLLLRRLDPVNHSSLRFILKLITVFIDVNWMDLNFSSTSVKCTPDNQNG